MNNILCSIILATLLGIGQHVVLGQAPRQSLGRVADKALTEGKEATLNVGFARMLGLAADKPIPLMRLQFESRGTTNVFNVVRDTSDTIILFERRENFTTYYLADRSGTLRRAVINDSTVANGGVTNLNLQAAIAGFEKQKRFWSERIAR